MSGPSWRDSDLADERPSDGPRYPDVVVSMVGEDGNAFAVLGRVRRALRRAGVDDAEIARFSTEAMVDDYDHLLATVIRWVEVQ